MQRDELNLTKAARVLEAEHLGLRDVKRQILELIAVGRLKQNQRQRQKQGGEAAPAAAAATAGPSDDKMAAGRGTGSDSGSDRGDGGDSGITSKVLCLIGPPG